MRASASRLATVQWARARAKSASLVRRSFHTPRPPEAIATMYGSLTGQSHPRPGTCRGRRRRSAQTRRPTLGRSGPGSNPGGRSGIVRPRARDRGAGMRRAPGPITPSRSGPALARSLARACRSARPLSRGRRRRPGVLQPLEVTTAGEPIRAQLDTLGEDQRVRRPLTTGPGEGGELHARHCRTGRVPGPGARRDQSGWLRWVGAG